MHLFAVQNREMYLASSHLHMHATPVAAALSLHSEAIVWFLRALAIAFCHEYLSVA